MKKKNVSGQLLIWIYLAVTVLVIFLGVHRFNGLITNHDNKLTIDIGNLMAEKMNSSIQYMQQSVEEMASVLSYQDLLELDQLYGQLVESAEEADYLSIGIIDIDGNVYGLESEKLEMEKWRLVEMAEETDSISISEPYRSAVSGKLVFTMFSPIFQQGKRLGCIFVTYPLSEIQEIANTDVLKDEAEIYLMDARSNNVILCSGSDEYAIGKWNSTYLLKHDISEDTIMAYEDWKDKMGVGNEAGAIKYVYNGVEYTQVSERIESMKDWYIVVRIPNSYLSNTLQQFRSVTVILVAVLVFVSILLLFVQRRNDRLEKEKFEYMSTHDPLTNVYNRNAFDLIGQKYLDGEGKTKRGVLVFLDLDYFKQINDNYGHDIGDKSLIAFSGLLKELFGEDSFVARYGGDEFVLLVRNVSTNEKLNERLEFLKKKLSEVKLGDNNFLLHYSAGIVAFPDYGHSFEELVKYADDALYKVKERGRNGYMWYKK
ncbi:MAG: diguanylate cyclase domain-containing protein [Lachnospiraceae bacterium]